MKEVFSDAGGHGHDRELAVHADARGEDRAVGDPEARKVEGFARRRDDRAAIVDAHARAAEWVEGDRFDLLDLAAKGECVITGHPRDVVSEIGRTFVLYKESEKHKITFPQ